MGRAIVSISGSKVTGVANRGRVEAADIVAELLCGEVWAEGILQQEARSKTQQSKEARSGFTNSRARSRLLRASIRFSPSPQVEESTKASAWSVIRSDRR